MIFLISSRDRLSVADVVALEHRLGLMKAAAFVAEVDPWCYPHDETRVPVLVKIQVERVVAEAAHVGKTMKDFTDASITEFLLSPLLILLIRNSKAQRSVKKAS